MYEPEIRPATLKDALQFEESLSASEHLFLNSFYNYPNLSRAVETGCFSFSIIDEKGEATGLAVFDFEPINSAHISEDCFALLTKSNRDFSPFNSIFMSLFIAKNFSGEQLKIAFFAISKTVFARNPEIEAIVFLDEKKEIEESQISLSMRQFFSNRLVWQNFGPFKAFHKSSIISRLNFRPAREEDQDDLSLVCNGQTNLTTGAFGAFFLSEMISSEKRSNLCLAAENENKKAVGLAVISSNLNFGVLLENFELGEFNSCVRSDFHVASEHQSFQLERLSDLQAQFREARRKEELGFYKRTCSKLWTVLELQEFCFDNRGVFLGEFQPILNDAEKQKTLNKNILKRKLDKLLKPHKISAPNEIFAHELDSEVYSLTMSTSDLLLETLRLFDLPAGYLEGEGHWSIWLKRRQEERNEEARQKDILGKKKARPKKNKFAENKENQLTTPQWFDIEPFFVSLRVFIACNSTCRKRAAEVIRNCREKLLPLFCAENGELLQTRVIDLSDLSDFLSAATDGALEEDFLQALAYILVCFGGLGFDQEVVTLREQIKGKAARAKDKSAIRTLRKISFSELMAAVELIEANERVLAEKSFFLESLAQSFNARFVETAEKFLAESHREFKTSEFFPNSFLLSLDKEINLPNVFSDVPEQLKNAVCWNIFFIDKRYEESSQDFLFHMFNHFSNFDYLLMTIPHKTPHFSLLDKFIYVKPKSSSNFPHALFLCHKSVLISRFAQIRLSCLSDLKICQSSENSKLELQKKKLEFEVLLCDALQNPIVVGKAVAFKFLTLPELKQNFELSSFLYADSISKNEVLELSDFYLQPLFKTLDRFFLREMLRLSKCKLLVKEQGNSALAKIADLFFSVKKFSQPNLIFDESLYKTLKNSTENLLYCSNTKRAKAGLFCGPLLEQNNRLETFGKPGQGLSLATPRTLSAMRTPVNARIVVIGASSCGLAFVESLLNDHEFNFTSISLISETFDWARHVIETKPKKLEHLDCAMTVSAILQRVSVIPGKMTFLDRKKQSVLVRSFSGAEISLEYDFLVFSNSLEEKTFENLSEKKSQGELLRRPKLMFAVDRLHPDLCEALCTNQKLPLFLEITSGLEANKKIPGLLSRDFLQQTHEYSEIKDLLEDDLDVKAAFIGRKNWFDRITQNRASMKIVLYGFSSNILVALEQLLQRWQVPAANLVLVIPRKLEDLDKENTTNISASLEKRLEFIEKNTETPIGINNPIVREFYLKKLAEAGVSIYKDFEICDFSYAENSVTLRSTNAHEKEKPVLADKRKHSRFSNNLNTPKNPEKAALVNNSFNNSALHSHLNEQANEPGEGDELYFENCLFVTGDFFDIPNLTFRTIQENGLVYNGRLIVQANFQTVDEHILGAGKICEFSQRYKGLALGRSLRMDKFNQKEVGQKLADCFKARLKGEGQLEELPAFQKPAGFACTLALGFFTAEIEVPFQGKCELENSLSFEHNDLLDREEQEFASFGFDGAGVLKRFFYFGRRVLQMEATQNLIGLHRSYFNSLFAHAKSGLVKSFVAFLDEGWAKLIFHPKFPLFKQIMGKIVRGGSQHCSVDLCEEEGMKAVIEEGIVDFITEHKDLLKYYFVPQAKVLIE